MYVCIHIMSEASVGLFHQPDCNFFSWKYQKSKYPKEILMELLV